MAKFALIFFALFSVDTALAVVTTGKIISYAPTQWDVFLFSVSNKTSPVNCDTNVGYAIPTNTSWGKAAIASVIAAKASGNTVVVEGTGECAYWGNTENFSYMTVQ